MILEDRNKIKKIVFKHPEIMSDNAEELIKDKFYTIHRLDKELHDLRSKVNTLEIELRKKEDEYKSLENLFTIEYDTYEKEYHTNNISMGIINSEDARNI